MKPSTYSHHILTAPTAIIRNASYHLQRKYESIPRSKRHVMLAVLCLASLLGVGAISGVSSLRHRTDHAKEASQETNPFSGNYSTSMALSIIARRQGIMTDNTQPGAALQAGIVQKAFNAHNAYHGAHAHPEIQEYIENSTASAAKYMASTIDDVKNWPLDRLSNGNAMLLLSNNANANDNDAAATTYALALTALRDSVRLNRRNNELGLWYWESYPDWSYLDGMYSLGPFAALDAQLGTLESSGVSDSDDPTNNATKALEDGLEDVQLQFRLLWDHCYNATTGLLVHGYDASHRASWASRLNGASAVVWGRSLGWFMMALVDTLELLSADVSVDDAPLPGALHADLLDMYQQLAPAVVKYADKNSRGWFQVIDMAGREGNYVESSATAMFAYALLKGARLRYLGPNDLAAATDAGRAAHTLLVRDFVMAEQDGTLGWGGTVAVCSLNSTATYDVSFPCNPF